MTEKYPDNRYRATFYIEQTDYERLQKKLRERGMNVSSWIRIQIRNFLRDE